MLLKSISNSNSRVRFFILGAAISAILFVITSMDVISATRPLASSLDPWLSEWVQSFRNPILTIFMRDMSAFGSLSGILTLLVFIISLLIMKRNFKAIALICVVGVGAKLWPPLLKILFERPRPHSSTWLVEVSQHSFPSGHTFGATAVYLALAYLANFYFLKRTHQITLLVLASALAFIVGLTRIYLGVHHPTDVLAGWVGGACWCFMGAAIYETRLASLNNSAKK